MTDICRLPGCDLPLRRNTHLAERVPASIRNAQIARWAAPRLCPVHKIANQGLHNHGLNIDKYMEMYDSQDGCCAICGTWCLPVGSGTGQKSGSNGILCVDHDHRTHKVRGLLCWSCNIGIGHFNDSEDVLRAVLRYLRRSR